MSILKQLGICKEKDSENEEIVYNIAKAYYTIERSIEETLSHFDLSLAKFNIMLVVKHTGKDRGIAQNEISEKLLVTTSNMTRMIDKLEHEGLVTRHSLKGDRRIKLIKITHKGSELLDKAWIPYKKAVDDLVGSRFSKTKKEEVNNILGAFNRG